MNKKYILATLLNCSKIDFGSHVNAVYLVLLITLDRPWVLLISNIKRCTMIVIKMNEFIKIYL